jgi:hypothetical protein
VSRGHPIEPGSETPFQKRIIIEIDGSTSVPTLTDGDTTTATTTADPSHTGELSIATIHADASGDDRENLNDEYIVFENSGEEAIDFSGWTVSDEADHNYTFPDGFTLGPGEKVTLHTGSGTDTETDLYWEHNVCLLQNNENLFECGVGNRLLQMKDNLTFLSPAHHSRGNVRFHRGWLLPHPISQRSLR